MAKAPKRKTTPPSAKTALDNETGKDYHFARLGRKKRFAGDRPPTNAHTKGRFGRPI